MENIMNYLKQNNGTTNKYLTSNRLSNIYGFTLIELILVIALIAVVGALASPKFLGSNEIAKDKAAKIKLEMVANAFKMTATKFDEHMMVKDNPSLITRATINDNISTSTSLSSKTSLNHNEEVSLQCAQFFVNATKILKDEDIIWESKDTPKDGYQYQILTTNFNAGTTHSQKFKYYAAILKYKNGAQEIKWGNVTAFENGTKDNFVDGSVLFLGEYMSPR